MITNVIFLKNSHEQKKKKKTNLKIAKISETKRQFDDFRKKNLFLLNFIDIEKSVRSKCLEKSKLAQKKKIFIRVKINYNYR